VVTLIVCKNSDGAYLVYTRGKQPFLGKVGFPYGKVHLGESVHDAAERELREKTGISARMEQKGIVYLLVKDTAGEVVTHMLAHVFLAQYKKGEASDAPFGPVSWVYKKDIGHLQLMPGVIDILRIAESASPHLTFEELSFEEA
jgi:8-oxo-dGTP diphosphatase